VNAETTIERLCRVPAEFRLGGKSARQLVRASGVEPASLSADSVISVLRANPHLVEDWLRWSEDQRCTPSYYFLEERGTYVVGLVPGKERTVFSDRITACADFIIKQARQIW
jgi:hypothetical protein